MIDWLALGVSVVNVIATLILYVHDRADRRRRSL